MGTLIGVHGLDNKPSREDLARGWELAIREGLEGTWATRKLPFAICYWADLYYDQAQDAEPEPYTCRSARIVPSPGHDPRTENQSLHQLSPEAMGRRYPDLVRYYREPELGKRTRRRLARILEHFGDDSLLLICHSMGCLIAYDVLSDPAFRSVHCEMATFGCPFGYSQLWTRMQSEHGQLKIPAPIHAWYNYVDVRDPVATTELDLVIGSGLACGEIQDRLVHNDYRNPSGGLNPHKIYGYLRSKPFAEQVGRFLDARPRSGARSRTGAL